MVKNSTNIDKTNNHLSSVNSPNTKKATTYDAENTGPGLEQTQNCGGIKSINRFPTLPKAS